MFEEFALTYPKKQKDELPSLIRIGNYKGNTANIPVLLPLEAMNGLCFETNGQTRTGTLLQMQYIALSLLKQMSPELLKLTFVDIGLTTNFPMLHSLKGYQIKFITGKGDLKKETDELFKTARYISTQCLGGDFTDLTAYNREVEADYKEPYNMLFIANFPNEFGEEEINAVSELITNGAKCGIRVMMHLDKEFFPDDKSYDKKRFAKLFAIQNQMPYLDVTKSKATLSNFDGKVIQDFFAKYEFEFEDYPQNEINSLIKTFNKEQETQSSLPENFISIKIGRCGREDVYFEMGEKAGVKGGLIAGASGTGKTTLLNNIITSIADKYSPDELRLYLFDYKEGVEFQIFENHPNVELLLLDNSNFEVGVSSLKKFQEEIKNRGDLFTASKVRDINEYNSTTSDRLPRMLMIIDEVQQLFTFDYQSKREVNKLVADIAKRGRAFGIHLLFSSQSYASNYIDDDAKSQMELRISYNLADGAECRGILGRDNEDPLDLPRFHLVYNTAFGKKTEGKNKIVKAYDFKRENVIALLEQAAEKYKDSKPFEKKVIKRKGETDETPPTQPDNNPSLTNPVERKEYKNNDYANEFGF